MSSSALADYKSPLWSDLKERMEVTSAEKDIQDILKTVRKPLEAIKRKKSSLIPETTLAKILANNGQIPDVVARKVKKRGILIVRKAVDSELIHEWMADLFRYLYVHNAFPKENQVSLFVLL